MKITIEDINKIISDCKSIGYNVRMSDIAYAILSMDFKDAAIPYTTLYGKGTSDEDIKKFDKNKNMKFLKKYIQTNFKKDEDSNDKEKQDDSIDLTFEDNKEAMIKMIDEAERKYKNHEIEWDKYSDRVSKLRIALNDKFKVSEKQDEHRIIVYAKYDAICPYCHHEVKSKPAEEAIREIKEKYDLVPKKNIDNSDNVNIFGDE